MILTYYLVKYFAETYKGHKNFTATRIPVSPSQWVSLHHAALPDDLISALEIVVMVIARAFSDQGEIVQEARAEMEENSYLRVYFYGAGKRLLREYCFLVPEVLAAVESARFHMRQSGYEDLRRYMVQEGREGGSRIRPDNLLASRE